MGKAFLYLEFLPSASAAEYLQSVPDFKAQLF